MSCLLQRLLDMNEVFFRLNEHGLSNKLNHKQNSSQYIEVLHF